MSIVLQKRFATFAYNNFTKQPLNVITSASIVVVDRRAYNYGETDSSLKQ